MLALSAFCKIIMSQKQKSACNTTALESKEKKYLALPFSHEELESRHAPFTLLKSYGQHEPNVPLGFSQQRYQDSFAKRSSKQRQSYTVSDMDMKFTQYFSVVNI